MLLRPVGEDMGLDAALEEIIGRLQHMQQRCSPEPKLLTPMAPILPCANSDNSWAVLFSHPKNLTPMRTIELGYSSSLSSTGETSKSSGSPQQHAKCRAISRRRKGFTLNTR